MSSILDVGVLTYCFFDCQVDALLREALVEANITVIESNSTLLDDPSVDIEADSLFVSKCSIIVGITDNITLCFYSHKMFVCSF